MKPRLPQEAVLHYETYLAAGEEGVLADYDERWARSISARELKASGWVRASGQQATERVEPAWAWDECAQAHILTVERIYPE